MSEAELLFSIIGVGLGLLFAFLALNSSEGNLNRNLYHPSKTAIDRSKCPGADDPEERCPRHPKDCVCWVADPSKAQPNTTARRAS